MTEDNTRVGTSSFDKDIRRRLKSLLSNPNVEVEDVLDYPTVFLRRVNLAKLLAQIELFKKTVQLPGSVVELGVFKGSSFMTFLKLCDIYCPGDTLKRVIGFDTWEGFLDLHDNDGPEDSSREKRKGGFAAGSYFDILLEAISIEQQDSFIPRFKRAELVRGDCRLTVPKYVTENPGLRISLLHLDLDLYEPTLVALKYLYPLVVPGGVVIFDEYGMVGFPGETKAIDEYFHGEHIVIEKFPFISTPGGFLIKN